MNRFEPPRVYRELIVDIGEVKRAQASPATANRTLALIRSILRIARDEWEWVDKVPHVRLYPEAKRRVRWLTTEEAARSIKELSPHLADMAATISYCH